MDIPPVKPKREKRRKRIISKATKPKATTFKKIILKSKRGLIINRSKMCSGCGFKASPVTRYRESNVGQVYLCPECKDKVRQESFGGADVWSLRYR